MKQSSSNPLQSLEAAALLKKPGALKELLQSPEAKKLLTMLNASHNDRLQSAAKQAKSGDTAALMSMVNEVLQQPEGAALMEEIESKFQKKTH